MIGGNITGTIQMLTVTQDDIGCDVESWEDSIDLCGFLDLNVGDSTRTFNTKIQESSHIFMCDYQNIGEIKPENSRMVIDGQIYEITLIDDPMNLHEHLEIFLKYLGG